MSSEGKYGVRILSFPPTYQSFQGGQYPEYVTKYCFQNIPDDFEHYEPIELGTC